VLQCIASFLQCVAICCNMLQCVAVNCSVSQCVGSVLQRGLYVGDGSACVCVKKYKMHQDDGHGQRLGVCPFVCCSVLQCVLQCVLQ